jgi:hypothetical protein
MSEAITLVGMAHDQYRLAMEEYQRKRASYIQAIAYARDEGESYSTIGRAVGLTRQRVFRLLNGE